MTVQSPWKSPLNESPRSTSRLMPGEIYKTSAPAWDPENRRAGVAANHVDGHGTVYNSYVYTCLSNLLCVTYVCIYIYCIYIYTLCIYCTIYTYCTILFYIVLCSTKTRSSTIFARMSFHTLKQPVLLRLCKDLLPTAWRRGAFSLKSCLIGTRMVFRALFLEPYFLKHSHILKQL